MTKIATSITLAIVLLATAALAHNGVKNAAVMARMNGMSAIAANMKTLGTMAKGTTPFDRAKAQAAAAAIADHAAAVPDQFRAAETDPKSEARDLIWQNYADFEAKSQSLETAARRAVDTIQSQADLGPALAEIGTTCKACHKLYRK